MDFSSVWRRRHACERCRHLKVRCEYATPAAPACVRCTRQGAECVTRDSPNGPPKPSAPPTIVLPPENKKNGNVQPADQSKKAHAGMLLQMLTGAQAQLAELEQTPVRQALTADLYTIEEADALYELFLAQPKQLLPLPLKPTLAELDEEYPQLAIAIVTAMALSISSTRVSDREAFVHQIYIQVLGGMGSMQSSLDSQLAMAVLCAYALPYAERGLSRLFAFHSVTLCVVRKLLRTNDLAGRALAQQTAMLTLLPYALTEEFQPVADLLPKVLVTIDRSVLGPAASVVEAMVHYHQAQREMSTVHCSQTLTQIYEQVNTAITMLECQRYMPALRWVFMLAQLKLMRSAAVRAALILDSAADGDDEDARELLRATIEQANILCGKFARDFSESVDAARPVLPTYAYYSLGDMLICLHAMRYIAFATKTDVDVHVDCLQNIVNHKWNELAVTSFVARQGFLSLFKAKDMLNIKIGHWDATARHVTGSGALPSFEIYDNFAPREGPQRLGVYTAEDVRAIIRSEADRTVESQLKTFPEGLSLRTMLHIVLGDLSFYD